MFRFFVSPLAAMNMHDLSELQPVVLDALLERAWNEQAGFRQSPAAGVEAGHPHHRSDIFGRDDNLVNSILNTNPQRIAPRTGTINVPALNAAIQSFASVVATTRLQGVRWPHLIYAYMIENTRVIEVFRRVLDSCLHGEQLGVLSAASQRWMWTTEEMFFRDPPSFSIGAQTSHVRPSLAATRANAYQRLFGMTLNASDTAKSAFTVAQHANADFVQVLDELLHEIWQGRTNFANAAGARPTDDSKIAERATRLGEMLRARRINGTLSREEFTAVSTLQWFHETLETADHPILIDLRAQAPSPEERLFKIAQRINHPAHGLAKSYFEIAEPLSNLLIAVEEGTYNDSGAVPALYTPSPPAPPGGPSSDTDLIMTHWSIIRGRDVKARKVA
jgi:hypothetical protein